MTATPEKKTISDRVEPQAAYQPTLRLPFFLFPPLKDPQPPTSTTPATNPATAITSRPQLPSLPTLTPAPVAAAVELAAAPSPSPPPPPPPPPPLADAPALAPVPVSVLVPVALAVTLAALTDRSQLSNTLPHALTLLVKAPPEPPLSGRGDAYVTVVVRMGKAEVQVLTPVEAEVKVRVPVEVSEKVMVWVTVVRRER